MVLGEQGREDDDMSDEDIREIADYAADDYSLWRNYAAQSEDMALIACWWTCDEDMIVESESIYWSEYLYISGGIFPF